MPDYRQRFTFENTPIRGELCQLASVYQRVLKQHDYPPLLRHWLGEMLAAVSLLGSTIKFDGSLIIQVQSDGPLRLLVGESDPKGGMRAYARWDEESTRHFESAEPDLRALCPGGLVIITIDPGPDMERYQGIVQLESSLARSIEEYFERSEQLATRIWLSTNPEQGEAAGLLLQRLPNAIGDYDDWVRVGMLADTLSDQELLQEDSKTILHRLFHEDDLRLFTPQPVYFACHCSRERVEGMLRSLGDVELQDILREKGLIEVLCEYCQAPYQFDQVDVAALLASEHPGLLGSDQVQ